jgi:hypothetical protein
MTLQPLMGQVLRFMSTSGAQSDEFLVAKALNSIVKHYELAHIEDNAFASTLQEIRRSYEQL